MTAEKKNAQEVAEEFRQYAYSVSHDLGSPVRAMVELSKLLAEEHTDALNEEGKEYLSLIIENGRRLQEMMEGLLQYSRLNAATGLVKTDLNKVVEGCLGEMKSGIEASRARIEVSELPVVETDPAQCWQLFGLLIDNAIKFQPEKNIAQISVAAEKKGNVWEFSVADNGIGILPQHQEKIFQLFQRLHTDREYPGVGIGLALAQKIVKRHGGKIWLEQSAHKGAVFRFTLSGE
jgi:light-regulated signal transduction histidine kinase (bacteriophytochrome)